MTREFNPYEVPECVVPKTTPVHAVQTSSKNSIYTALMPVAFTGLTLFYGNNNSIFHPLTLTATTAAISSTIYSARAILKNRI